MLYPHFCFCLFKSWWHSPGMWQTSFLALWNCQLQLTCWPTVTLVYACSLFSLPPSSQHHVMWPNISTLLSHKSALYLMNLLFANSFTFPVSSIFCVLCYLNIKDSQSGMPPNEKTNTTQMSLTQSLKTEKLSRVDFVCCINEQI